MYAKSREFGRPSPAVSSPDVDRYVCILAIRIVADILQVLRCISSHNVILRDNRLTALGKFRVIMVYAYSLDCILLHIVKPSL